jgi:uncharacterized membrane protein HdeD (DUF308 family)
VVAVQATQMPERSRTMLVTAGVIAIVLGLVAILAPALASVGTAVFIGILLLLSSLAIGIGALAVEGLGRKLLRGLIALLTFAAGLYLLVAPLDGVFTLTVMLVIWFVAVGITRIATGLAELGTPGAGYTIVAGVTSLLLGIFIGNELPSSADWAIGLLVGIDFLMYGALALAAAWLPADRP